MGFEAGKPRHPAAGRKPGTPNILTMEFAAKLASLKCDPEEKLVRISQGNLPCSVCHATGRTKYKVIDKKTKEEKIFDRVCESCFGTLKEKIGPDLILKASAELMKYLRPQRKAVEVTGTLELTASLESRLLAGRKRLAGPNVIDLAVVHTEPKSE